MEREFDLLGDPIPANWGRRGRPEHIATQENRSKIRVLLGFGWANDRIARALRISKSTLKVHYSAELRFRDEARDALKAAHIEMVYRSAAGGAVGAMRLLGEMILADERRDLAERFGDDRPPAKPAKLGKKEQAQVDAQAAAAGDDSWGDDLDVGTAPVH